MAFCLRMYFCTMVDIDNLRNPVVLFDGVCNYCNTMVNFAIKWNRKKNLRFAPLQSEVGIALKEKYHIAPTVDSVVFIEQGKVYIHSSAALRICRHLSFPVKVLYFFILVPRFIREGIYKWVARNRYKWFGKKESCMIPTSDVRALFLN